MLKKVIAYRGRSATLLLVLAVAWLATPAGVRAQTSDDEGEQVMPRAGTWALQFQITRNFTLSSFQGATISAKRQLAAQRAWRIGVSLGAGVANAEREREEQPGELDSLLIVQRSESRSNHQSIALNAQYLWYRLSQHSIKMYFGGGPEVGFSRREGYEEHTLEGREVIKTKRMRHSMAVEVGVIGLVGVSGLFAPT